MSLIFFHTASAGKVTVCCSQCSAIVGEMSLQEVGELSTKGIEVTCFDCEPVGVDDIPRQMFSPLDHYLLGIGNKVFLAEWITDTVMPECKDLRLTNISLTTYFDLKTGYGPKFVPLSSSLNLNIETTKNEVFSGDR